MNIKMNKIQVKQSAVEFQSWALPYSGCSGADIRVEESHFILECFQRWYAWGQYCQTLCGNIKPEDVELEEVKEFPYASQITVWVVF